MTAFQTNQGFETFSLINMIKLEVDSELRKTFRTPGFVIPAILFPVMFYFFFGVVFGSHQMDGNMPSYLLATYGVFGIVGPGLFSFGADIATEKDKGLLQMKRVSPLPIGVYFFAKSITSLVFAIVIVALLFGLAMGGAGVSLTFIQWTVTAGLLVLGVFPFCALGLCIGLTAKAQSAAALVNLIYLPMSFLSGLWIPLTVLPNWMTWVAQLLPPYHLSQLVLKLQGFDMGQSVWIHCGALVFSTIVFTYIACTLFAKTAGKREA